MNSHFKNRPITDILNERCAVIVKPLEESVTHFLNDIEVIQVNTDTKQYTYVLSDISVDSSNFLSFGIRARFKLINTETFETTSIYDFVIADGIRNSGDKRISDLCSYHNLLFTLRSVLRQTFRKSSIGNILIKEGKKKHVVD